MMPESGGSASPGRKPWRFAMRGKAITDTDWTKIKAQLREAYGLLKASISR